MNDQTPTERRWLSQVDAAKRLGVTDRTVRRMITAGELPAYRLGPRLIRIDAADLDALLTPVEPEEAGR